MNVKYMAAVIVSHVLHDGNDDVGQLIDDVEGLLEESVIEPSRNAAKVEMLMGGAKPILVLIPLSESKNTVIPIASIIKLVDDGNGGCMVHTKDEDFKSHKNSAHIAALMRESGMMVYADKVNLAKS